MATHMYLDADVPAMCSCSWVGWDADHARLLERVELQHRATGGDTDSRCSQIEVPCVAQWNIDCQLYHSHCAPAANQSTTDSITQVQVLRLCTARAAGSPAAPARRRPWSLAATLPLLGAGRSQLTARRWSPPPSGPHSAPLDPSLQRL